MRYRPYICPFGLLIEQIPSGSRVLDIGCGGGLFLNLLAHAGKLERGIGIDTNQGMIDLASVAAKSEQHPIHFLQCDANEPWPTDEIDVLTMIDVMHHIPPASQEQVLGRLCATVPVGGRLVYKDMCRTPRWRAVANRGHDLLLARQWIHYLPIERVEEAARRAGLKEVARFDRQMLWYGHELRVYERSA